LKTISRIGSKRMQVRIEMKFFSTRYAKFTGN
jgi:hypothetical protein